MRKALILMVLIALSCTMICAHATTGISFDTVNIGGDQWQYLYTVSNISLPVPIEEFSIYFDYGLYSNLSIAGSLTGWDPIIWQPEPVLGDTGGYDALTLSGNPGIGVGQSVSGFSVNFTWLGQDSPGSQYYEIIDPLTFTTIDSSNTVPIPEPGMMVLLCSSLIVALNAKTGFKIIDKSTF
jgi:hypothetical protein